MKSNEFITEKAAKPYKSSVLDVNAAVAMLNAHCKQSLALIHTPIWRGMRNHSEAIVTIDPTTGRRISNNTSNHYTVLIDNSPYFKGWPKRSKSLVCSTGYKYAAGYNYGPGSGLYAIFPYDNVKIAVCPGQDIWDTDVNLPRLGESYGENGVNGALGEFNASMKYKFDLPDNFAAMKKAVTTREFAQTLSSHIRNQVTPEEARNPLQPYEFIDYLQQQMSPACTGFRLMDAATFAANPPKDRECWIGGPVVAIRKDMYKKFLDAVMKDPESAGNPPNAPTAKQVSSKKSAAPDEVNSKWVNAEIAGEEDNNGFW